MIIHASLARKASSPNIGFYRLDYPTPNPPEWHKWITLRLDKYRIVSAEVPLGFWKPMIENYEKHNHWKWYGDYHVSEKSIRISQQKHTELTGDI